MGIGSRSVGQAHADDGQTSDDRQKEDRVRARDIKPGHWYLTKFGRGECMQSVTRKLGERVVQFDVYRWPSRSSELMFLLPRDVLRPAEPSDTLDELRLKKAPAGMEFTSKVFRATSCIVGKKCDKDTGHWHCITHDQAFRNQLEKDLHIGSPNVGDGTQTHMLAWVCADHGVETP